MSGCLVMFILGRKSFKINFSFRSFYWIFYVVLGFRQILWQWKQDLCVTNFDKLLFYFRLNLKTIFIAEHQTNLVHVKVVFWCERVGVCLPSILRDSRRVAALKMIVSVLFNLLVKSNASASCFGLPFGSDMQLVVRQKVPKLNVIRKHLTKLKLHLKPKISF